MAEPIKCPHCGESYYQEGMSTCTCMYYPPIYKDGVNINPDRNIHTTYCHCLACGKEFIITSRYGEETKVSKCEKD